MLNLLQLVNIKGEGGGWHSMVPFFTKLKITTSISFNHGRLCRRYDKENVLPLQELCLKRSTVIQCCVTPAILKQTMKTRKIYVKAN
jgi:hypothetical protein